MNVLNISNDHLSAQSLYGCEKKNMYWKYENGFKHWTVCVFINADQLKKLKMISHWNF